MIKIPTKKLKSGFEISVLGLGTARMGGYRERDLNYLHEEKDITTIRRAIELGVNRFDTAESYAEGYAEEIIGKAIKGFNRSTLFLASKVAPSNLDYDNVLKSAEGSMKRLGTDYLDLYMIHKPNHDIDIKDTLRAFDRLVEENLVKNIGVSNFNVESLKRAEETSKNKIVLNQVHYNLLFREPVLGGVLDYCQDNDVFMEAWRPLQQGNLSRPGIKILDELCRKYDKTQSQVALNWLLVQENVITTVKTGDLEHLTDNLGAIGWEMDRSDVDLLTASFPIQLDRSNAVQLS